ncbi:MAG: tetratricopeptide repeat protein [Spirochaetales bacterium]
MSYHVFRGNRAFQSGNFQEAQLAYLKALATGKHTEWIHYNLGTVYYSLGEKEPALKEWEKALTTSNAKLRFHVLFNKGFAALELGKAKEAEKFFIQALELDPKSIAAKVNLEYATQLAEAPSADKGKSSGTPKPEGLSQEGEQLLQYFRQKENTRWIGSSKIVQDADREDW